MCFPDGGVSSRNRRRKRHYCGGTAAVRYPMTFSLCGIIRRGDRSAVYTFGVLSAAIVPGALSACAPEGARTFRSCGYPAKHVRGRIPPPGFSETELPRQRMRRYPERAGTVFADVIFREISRRFPAAHLPPQRGFSLQNTASDTEK